MNVENFKTAMLKKFAEIHKDIMYDLCTLNNCADCYNDETRHTECNPVAILNPIKLSNNGFYLEMYDCSKRNRRMIDVANNNGYKCGIIFEDGISLMKFWK